MKLPNDIARALRQYHDAVEETTLCISLSETDESKLAEEIIAAEQAERKAREELKRLILIHIEKH